MTPERLLSSIQIAIGIFAVVIVILLIIPKWRKKLTQPEAYSPRKQRGIGLLYGIEFIFYPILGLFKIIFSIFK